MKTLKQLLQNDADQTVMLYSGGPGHPIKAALTNDGGEWLTATAYTPTGAITNLEVAWKRYEKEDEG